MKDIMGEIGRSFSWLPNWATSFVILSMAVLLGLCLHRLVFGFFHRLVESRGLFWRSIVSRTERPARFALIVTALGIAVSLAPLSPFQTSVARHFLLIALISLIAWIARSILHIWSTLYLRRFRLDAEDNLLARKHITQFRIIRRILDTVIVLIAAAAALMTFDAVRQYGVSLLASAGAAGIVVGLALQPVLKNLLAGVQLAITQPIRIDDQLVVEGESGRVEEINSTYVVVKLWDWRRLILPLNYFIEQPFQNWTRESASLIGSVMLYLDYAAPIDAIRAKAEEVVRASPLFDGQVASVAVTGLREDVMEVRVLLSAANAGKVFDLCCEVREKLITYIQAEHPDALPRTRLRLAGEPRPDPVSQGRRSDLLQ